MVSKLFQTNHDNAQDIIDIVYLARHAMGKGCTSNLHKLLAATQIEKLSNTRIANPVWSKSPQVLRKMSGLILRSSVQFSCIPLLDSVNDQTWNDEQRHTEHHPIGGKAIGPWTAIHSKDDVRCSDEYPNHADNL